MTTGSDTRILVARALTRLREDRLFITLVSGSRHAVDDVLAGVLAQWGQQEGLDGLLGGELEYQVVIAGHVHGLVIAAGPHAMARVQAVTAGFVAPCTRALTTATAAAADRGWWRTWLGRAGALAPVVLGRRRDG